MHQEAKRTVIFSRWGSAFTPTPSVVYLCKFSDMQFLLCKGLRCAFPRDSRFLSLSFLCENLMLSCTESFAATASELEPCVRTRQHNE